MYESDVRIDGMMCGMCEAHINDTVRKEFGKEIKKVTSSHTKGLTKIVSEEPIDENRLKNAIDATGYQFVSMTTQKEKKHGLFGRHKDED